VSVGTIPNSRQEVYLTSRTLAARAALAIIAGVVVTWLLLGASGSEAALRISEVRGVLGAADRTCLGWAALLYVASIVLRAVRWSLLAQRSDAKPLRLLPVTAVHVGLGHILPARLSDVLMIGLLRGLLGVRTAHGTAAVLLSKLLDLLVVGLVVAFAVAGGSGSGRMTAAAAAILIGALAGLVFLRRLLEGFRKLAGRILEGRPRLARFLADLSEASGIWQEQPRRTLAAALVSIAIWLAKLFMFVELVSAIHLAGLPTWKIFFAAAVTELIMALPVQGLFSLGIAEAGWAAGLAMVGVGGEKAVISGFSIHLIWMTMAIGLMILALPALPFAAKGRAACRTPS
jgi:hypothetical protein